MANKRLKALNKVLNRANQLARQQTQEAYNRNEGPMRKSTLSAIRHLSLHQAMNERDGVPVRTGADRDGGQGRGREGLRPLLALLGMPMVSSTHQATSSPADTEPDDGAQ